jgi:3-deoxy-D-manno-octulosonic-acid transferase
VIRETGRQLAARLAYAWLLRLLTPFYLLRLWRRGAQEPLYRLALRERLGLYRSAAEPGRLWIHAVSLGETRAASALIDALRALEPSTRLLLTHSTATGRESGRALLREGDAQAWLPYDTPGAVRRFLAQFRPAVGVLMETEVWPNLLHAAQAQRLTMVLANARLSPRSFARGERLDALLRPAARSVALVLAQTADDAQRITASGAPQVEVSGNLKFDMAPEPALLAQGRAWHAALGRDVVLAASTREGEEAMLLSAWARQPAAARPLLLVVPRHPQRFDEVASLVRAAGLSLARRSAWAERPPADAARAEVWLGDSMREMALYYAIAQVALLGGSFEPLGGQNLIEAAACACPVVMGPHTFNFAEAAELALAAGAALRVADMAEGVATALRLLADAPRCTQAAAAAQGFAAMHQGAARRMARRVAGLLAPV